MHISAYFTGRGAGFQPEFSFATILIRVSILPKFSSWKGTLNGKMICI